MTRASKLSYRLDNQFAVGLNTDQGGVAHWLITDRPGSLNADFFQPHRNDLPLMPYGRNCYDLRVGFDVAFFSIRAAGMFQTPYSISNSSHGAPLTSLVLVPVKIQNSSALAPMPSTPANRWRN